MALQRILRGGYTAIGAVASGSTGNWLHSQIPDNDIAVDLAQAAVGATLSIGVAGFTGPGEMMDENGVLSEAIEFAGYGIQAAGWDELFTDLELGLTTGGAQFGSDRVVDVRSRASRVRTSGQTGTDSSNPSKFQADIG